MIKWLILLVSFVGFSVVSHAQSIGKVFKARTEHPTFFYNIDSALIHTDSITYIKLKGYNKIPEQLHKFKALETLSIDSCPDLDLKTAFDYIRKMKSIEYLLLAENGTKFYPKNLGRLKQLTALWIFDEPVRTLPSSVRRLKRLKEVIINDCYHIDLHAALRFLAPIRSIEELDLSYNYYYNTPPSLGKFTNLKTLWLEANNLVNIPEEVKQLPKLERLHIGDNFLNEIHLDSTDFPALKHIDLFWNRMKHVPMDFQYISTLEYLDLKANEYMEIGDLSPFHFLKTLNLKMCDIDYYERDEIKEQLPEIEIIF